MRKGLERKKERTSDARSKTKRIPLLTACGVVVVRAPLVSGLGGEGGGGANLKGGVPVREVTLRGVYQTSFSSLNSFSLDPCYSFDVCFQPSAMNKACTSFMVRLLLAVLLMVAPTQCLMLGDH